MFNETTIPIHADHAGICKFGEEDDVYKQVIANIADFIDWALKIPSVLYNAPEERLLTVRSVSNASLDSNDASSDEGMNELSSSTSQKL